MATKDEILKQEKVNIRPGAGYQGDWIKSDEAKNFLQSIQDSKQIYFKNMDPKILEMLSKLPPEDVMEYHDMMEVNAIAEEHARSLKASMDSGQLSPESNVNAINAYISLTNDLEANAAYGKMILNQVLNEQRENYRNRIKGKLPIGRRQYGDDCNPQPIQKPIEGDARPGVVGIRPKLNVGYSTNKRRFDPDAPKFGTSSGLNTQSYPPNTQS
jgi:hypothetical protein